MIFKHLLWHPCRWKPVHCSLSMNWTTLLFYIYFFTRFLITLNLPGISHCIHRGKGVLWFVLKLFQGPVSSLDSQGTDTTVFRWPGGQTDLRANSSGRKPMQMTMEGPPYIPGERKGLSPPAWGLPLLGSLPHLWWETGEAAGNLGSSQHLKSFFSLLVQPLRPSAKYFSAQFFRPQGNVIWMFPIYLCSVHQNAIL